MVNPGGVIEGFYDKMEEYLDNASQYYRVLSSGNKIDIEKVLDDESICEYVKYEGSAIILNSIELESVKKNL